MELTELPKHAQWWLSIGAMRRAKITKKYRDIGIKGETMIQKAYKNDFVFPHDLDKLNKE